MLFLSQVEWGTQLQHEKRGRWRFIGMITNYMAYWGETMQDYIRWDQIRLD